MPSQAILDAQKRRETLMTAYRSGDTATVNNVSAQNQAARTGQPIPATTPAQPAPQTTPTPSTPVQPAPTATTPTPPTETSSVTPTQPTIGGFDEAALLKSGVTQENINKMKAILGPTLNEQGREASRAGQYNEFIQQDLTDAQKETEAQYADIKKRKQDLATQALQINDDTTKVQGDLAAQEYQRNKFTNEQAQKQYELDQSRNEHDLQLKTEEDEIGFRRAIGAQLGAAFSSEGIYRYVQVKRQGSQMLSDLRSQTAIGKAEFAFKAQEIETKYTTNLKEISNDRRAQSFTVLQSLNDQLDEIDSKILTSREDKRKQARDAVKDYFDKLNDVDQKSAELTSGAVNSLFTEKKALEQEKLEKETFDQSMSESLGYYANKYGQAIGIRDGETPKPYAGEVNEFMSKQLGFLVDQRGQKILGNDGKQIPYRDLDAIEMDRIYSAIKSGTASPLDMSKAGSIDGENGVIATKFPDGSTGGQCGTFIRTQFTSDQFSYGINIAEKRDLVARQGISYNDWKGQQQVGDVVFTSEGSVGHVMLINKIRIDANGHRIGRVTESNYSPPYGGKVTNTREVDLDASQNIIGALRGHLKPEFSLHNPTLAAPQFDNEKSMAENLMDSQFRTVDQWYSLPQKDKMALTAKLGVTKINKWIQSKKTSGDNQFSIDKFKGDPNSYLALPDEERKRYQEIYSDDEIKKVLGGKSLTEVQGDLKKGDIDTNIKLSNLVKPIADGVREIELQGSAFVNVSPKQRDPYTDQTLVYTFNKLLDPGSVVKESEYSTVLKNSGWFQGFQGELSKANGTNLLTDQTRAKLLNEMKRLYEAKKEVYLDALREKRDFIQNQQIDANQIFPFENYLKDEKISASGGSPKGLAAALKGTKLYKKLSSESVSNAHSIVSDLYQ